MESLRLRAGALLPAILLALTAALPARAGEPRPDRGGLEAGLTLLDGREVPGKIVGISREEVELDGHRSFPMDAIQEIRPADIARAGPAPAAAAGGPGILFGSGEFLPGSIAGSDGKTLRIAPASAGPGGPLEPFGLPLGVIRAILLDPAAASEASYREAVEGRPPGRDLFLVHQGSGLLRVEGVLAALETSSVAIEHEGRSRRLRRDKVAAIVLSEVAGGGARRGRCGTVSIRGGGRIPADLVGLAEGPGGTRLRLEVLGVALEIPADRVLRATPAADRVLYLSDAKPTRTEGAGLLGAGFPHRPDRSVAGLPIRLGGQEHGKGIGVHPRSVLAFAVEGGYGRFAARVGIDDGGARGAGAVITVRGDGEVLHREVVVGGSPPRDLLIPIAGVRTLELEADFVPGSDGIGAHVDWAEARLLREEGAPRILTGS